MSPDRLDPDLPLTVPDDDQLGYAPFAKCLAKCIVDLAPLEGFVVSIQGAWGAGKSTTIQFVEYYLLGEPEARRPRIVRFNPWWYSGQEDLTKRFFAQLLLGLEEEKLRDVVVPLARYFGDLLSDAPIPEPARWYTSWIAWILKRVGVTKEGDIEKKKTKAREVLRNQSQKVVVILDDLDRLRPEEIRQVFRLIKAVANFPQVIYLLAFDKGVIIPALQEAGVNGADYLEKIVQLPFDLPLPDSEGLRQLFFSRLNKILANFPEEQFDQVRWGNVLHEGIAPFFTTPRDVIRLTNALAASYPAVGGEVDPIDFIAIEALRLFSPEVYELIRKNPGMFAGVVSGGRRSPADPFYENLLSLCTEADRPVVRKLLQRLFPRLEGIWNNMIYGASSLAEWRRKSRVCSPDCFDVYFRLALPVGSISNADMEIALSLANDIEAFSQYLLQRVAEKRLGGGTRLRAFLERLSLLADDRIQSDQIASIIRSILKAGDRLLSSKDERLFMFDFDNSVRIGWVFWPLLKRLPQEQRFEVLKSAINASESVSLTVEIVSHLSREQGRFTSQPPRPPGEALLSLEQVKELEGLTLARIRNARDQDRLLDVPHLSWVLGFWQNLAGKDEVGDWVAKITSSDQTIARFLGQFVSRVFRHVISDSVPQSFEVLDPKQLEFFIAPEGMVERAQRLQKAGRLSPSEMKSVELFLKGCEKHRTGQELMD